MSHDMRGNKKALSRLYGNVMADMYDNPNTPRMACGLVEKVSATDTSNKYQVKSISKMASYMATAAKAPGVMASDAPVLSGPVVITWVAKTTGNCFLKGLDIAPVMTPEAPPRMSSPKSPRRLPTTTNKY